jgi:hypothetical protein
LLVLFGLLGLVTLLFYPHQPVVLDYPRPAPSAEAEPAPMRIDTVASPSAPGSVALKPEEKLTDAYCRAVFPANSSDWGRCAAYSIVCYAVMTVDKPDHSPDEVLGCVRRMMTPTEEECLAAWRAGEHHSGCMVVNRGGKEEVMTFAPPKDRAGKWSVIAK